MYCIFLIAECTRFSEMLQSLIKNVINSEIFLREFPYFVSILGLISLFNNSSIISGSLSSNAYSTVSCTGLSSRSNKSHEICAILRSSIIYICIYIILY